VDLRQILLVAPVLLLSMVAHEFAHGYAALRQGEPDLVKQAKRVEQRRVDAAAKAESPASPTTA